MNKQEQEDFDRTLELKKKVWAYVARNIMNKEEKPYEITLGKIEGNRGRQKKALRLLEGTVAHSHTRQKKQTLYGYSNRHQVEEDIYVINAFEDSAAYTQEPHFITSLSILHDYIFNHMSSQHDMDTVGYRSPSDMAPEETLYVYWNQNKYHFIHEKRYAQVFPNVLLEQRTKTMLRAIVEQQFHETYHNKIEERLSLPTGSLKTEDSFTLNIRNSAAHGYRFSMEAFNGTGGFLHEYTHFRDYFEALLKNLNDFQRVIDAAGGHAALLKEFRIECIDNLLRRAPRLAFQPTDHKAPLMDNPYYSAFILRHSMYLIYETLYADDQTILVIDKHNQSAHITTDKLFEPNEHELDLIKGTDLPCTLPKT